MKKRIISILLASATAISLSACGEAAQNSASESPASQSSEATVEKTDDGESSAAETQEAAADASDPFAGLPDKQAPGEVVKATPEMYPDVDMSKSDNINIYMVGDTPNDWQVVCDAANEYLKPFNTTISATFLSWSDYQTLYPLALQGDDCDIIYTASWCFLGSEADKGSYHEITEDFLKEKMPLTYKYQAPDSWSEQKIAGKIYEIPQNMMESSGTKYIAIRQDLADKYGISEIKTWDDVMNFEKTIAEKETPESGILGYAAAADNNELWDVYRQQTELRNVVDNDLLDISYNLGDGSAPTLDDIKLVYDTDEFHAFAKDMKELADAGVWSRSALTNTTTKDEAFGALQSASDAWNTSLFTYIKQAEATDGVKCAVYDISQNTKAESGYGQGGLAIAEMSHNQDRAAMILDIMENDTYLNQLIIMGIEGTHYEQADATHYKELDKAADYAIWGTSASWAIKNYKLIDEAMDERQVAIEEETSARSAMNPTITFQFDDSNVSDYTAAIKNVLSEYVPSIQLGLVDDPEANIAEMKEKLTDAGLDTYMDEFKAKYQEWYDQQ